MRHPYTQGVAQTPILNAGQKFSYTVAASPLFHLIETSRPALVAHTAGLLGCKAELAFIPPLVFPRAPPSPGGGSSPFVFTYTVSTMGYGAGELTLVLPEANLTAGGGVALNDTLITSCDNRLADRNGTFFCRIRRTLAGGGTHVVTAGAEVQVSATYSIPGGHAAPYAFYSPYRIPFCGDGVLQPGEGCDDGNVMDGDGCTSSCRIDLEAANYHCTGKK
jgi:cysteine-rich repeat protein